VSITLGIAALVGIGSFRRSLSESIDEQASSLLGADLVVASKHPWEPADEEFLRSLGGLQAREVRLLTMAVLPKTNSQRLVHLRALDGDFPFYGTMETVPASAAHDFRSGTSAVVEESLLLQFQAQIGDPVKIGDAQFN